MKHSMKYVYYLFLIGALIWCAFEPCPHPEFVMADPLTLGLGVGAALGGAALNYLGQSETNDANAAMTREQMAWQSQENRKDREFQYDMIPYSLAEQWKYNDPAFLAQAYRNAGVNPAFALNGGVKSGSGMSPLNGSSHSVSSVGSVPYQSPLANFSLVSQNTLNMMSQIMGLEKQDLENQFLGASLESRKALIDATTEMYKGNAAKFRQDSANSYLDFLFKQKTFNNGIMKSFLDTKKTALMVQSQAEMLSQMELETAFKKMRNEFQGKLNEKQLKYMQAKIAEAYAIANNNNASASEKRENIKLIRVQVRKESGLANSAEAQGFIDKQLQSSKLFHIIDMYSQQDQINEATIRTLNHRDNIIQNYSPLVGGAASLGGAALLAY